MNDKKLKMPQISQETDLSPHPLPDCGREGQHFLFQGKNYKIFKHIVLVGVMGSGKTSTGRLLAKRLGMPFIDSDMELESVSGYGIVDLFELYGEERFREAESQVIQHLLKSPTPCVISSGGGAYLYPQTRRYIRERALAIWIHAQLNTLVQRVSRRRNRPLLNKGNHREILTQMMEDCYSIYQEADFAVDSESASPKATMNRVVEALCRFLDEKA